MNRKIKLLFRWFLGSASALLLLGPLPQGYAKGKDIEILTSSKKSTRPKENRSGDHSSDQKTEKVSSQANLSSERSFSRPGRHSLGLGLGQTFLRGDFRKNGKDSITFDLFYSYEASYSFDMLLDLHYSTHKSNERETELLGLAVGIKGKIYQIDSFTPFVIGGVGFYAPRVKRPLATDRRTVFGSQVGVGVDLALNQEFKVGLLGHLHNPFDVKQDLGPEVEGTYYKFLLTVFYTFP